jgi:uncharacterized protein with HEPN domain
MLKDDAIRLQHIITEAEEACTFAADMSFNEFLKDRKTAKAIIRSVEIIGEAAANLSNELRDKHRDIPWKQIIGMRNHLIHVYFDIDFRTVWQTVQVNLPPLISQLKRIIEAKTE